MPQDSDPTPCTRHEYWDAFCINCNVNHPGRNQIGVDHDAPPDAVPPGFFVADRGRDLRTRILQWMAYAQRSRQDSHSHIEELGEILLTIENWVGTSNAINGKGAPIAARQPVAPSNPSSGWVVYSEPVDRSGCDYVPRAVANIQKAFLALADSLKQYTISERLYSDIEIARARAVRDLKEKHARECQYDPATDPTRSTSNANAAAVDPVAQQSDCVPPASNSGA